MEILLGFTTTRSDRIALFLKEIRENNIERIALFPTALDTRQRRILYHELENSPVTRIPHVHLRSDMDQKEMEYLIDRFQTEVFNIHSLYSTHPYQPESTRYLKIIFIENSGVIPGEKELALYGGLCIDFSHWENGRRMNLPEYRNFAQLAESFPVGCCHVSAIHSTPTSPWNAYDDHEFRDLNEFDYLMAYRRYLPRWVSLELENSITEQMRAKAHLEKMLQPVADAR